MPIFEDDVSLFSVVEKYYSNNDLSELLLNMRNKAEEKIKKDSNDTENIYPEVTFNKETDELCLTVYRSIDKN